MANFIQQAYKGKNDWWRYLLTSIVVLSPFLLNIIIYFLMPELVKESREIVGNLDIDKNLFLFKNLIPFVLLLLILFLFVKYTHSRKVGTIISSRIKVDWNRFFFSFLLWSLISMIVIVIGYLTAPEDFIWNFKADQFLILIIISLIFIPLQTSFEELLFRGYFMQGLGIWFKNAYLPIIITSMAFGLLHSFNPEVEKLGSFILIYYISTGFLFGIITIMDEGTELALGMHAANNIVAAIIVTTDWMVFQTDALFIDTSEPSVGIEMFLPVFILYPLIIYIFSKKYHWSDWMQKLFGRINTPEEIIPNTTINQTIDNL